MLLNSEDIKKESQSGSLSQHASFKNSFKNVTPSKSSVSSSKQSGPQEQVHESKPEKPEGVVFSTGTPPQMVDTSSIKKPLADDRDIQALVLANGVKVMYVHDPLSTET